MTPQTNYWKERCQAAEDYISNIGNLYRIQNKYYEDWQSLVNTPEPEEGTGWISVSDRLPEDERMALCKTELEPIVNYVIASYDDRLKVWVDYDDYSYSVTHWMPLPSNSNNK